MAISWNRTAGAAGCAGGADVRGQDAVESARDGMAMSPVSWDRIAVESAREAVQ